MTDWCPTCRINLFVIYCTAGENDIKSTVGNVSSLQSSGFGTGHGILSIGVNNELLN